MNKIGYCYFKNIVVAGHGGHIEDFCAYKDNKQDTFHNLDKHVICSCKDISRISSLTDCAISLFEKIMASSSRFYNKSETQHMQYSTFTGTMDLSKGETEVIQLIWNNFPLRKQMLFALMMNHQFMFFYDLMTCLD